MSLGQKIGCCSYPLMSLSVSTHAWYSWHPSIPKKLEELHASGWAIFSCYQDTSAHANLSYQIVIFSNQNYAQDSLPAKHYKAKLKLIGPAINVPFSLFAGYERDAHRKPLPGMWQLLGQMSGQTKIDHTKSFYMWVLGLFILRLNSYAFVSVEMQQVELAITLILIESLRSTSVYPSLHQRNISTIRNPNHILYAVSISNPFFQIRQEPWSCLPIHR